MKRPHAERAACLAQSCAGAVIDLLTDAAAKLHILTRVR
jgi:hypothetical protein